jgi:dTDP-4-dehydrorhamnose 3,5-epimerase
VNRFDIRDTPLAGLKVVTRQRLGDSRGFLERMFCAEELASAGWQRPVAQINHTFTARKGTVRGMHFQRQPHAETKLVNCIAGEVWDVAIDLRAGSPTFLQWHAECLSASNGKALLIPEGFAHGFQTLSDDAHMIYCHSAAYTSAYEGGLHPGDTRLAITWPLPITELSARDAAHILLTPDFEGVRL